MVSDFKERVKTPSKKRTLSQINSVLRLAIWMCLCISGVLITVCAVAYISNSALFHVKRIDITGNAYIKRNEVLTLLDMELGDNILSWDMNKARQRLQNHPWIKEVSISRSFVPASVAVRLAEHKPRATLFLKDRPYLISEEGLAFASSADKYFGILINARDYTREDMKQGLDQVMNNAIEAARLVTAKGFKIRDIVVEPGGLVDLKLNNGTTLTIFGKMTPEKMVMAIKTFEKLKPPEGTVMDLRCDDKVVLRNRSAYGSQG